MDIDLDEIDPMAMLETEMSTNNDEPVLTFPETAAEVIDPLDDDDNDDVQEIIQETEIIDLDDDNDLDDTPIEVPVTETPVREAPAREVPVIEVPVTDVPATVNGLNHEPLKSGQIPDDYSEEESAFRRALPVQQAVQYQRFHCTACNAHLGSAPNNQSKRYVHPLLKVLICKACFEFYGSGDFDKDEDGSELYCRWCGQGGKVLCCANLKCPYVFCLKCVRLNLGKKELDRVKESDDWLCFNCNPKQIIGLRISCRALYDYVQQEIKSSAPESLTLDKSLCCNKPKPLVPKRKSIQEDKTKKKKQRINPVSVTDFETNTATSWDGDGGDEVVCTPDLTMLMGGGESPGRHLNAVLPAAIPPPSVSIAPAGTSKKDGNVQYIGQTKVVHYSSSSKTSNNLGYKLPANPPIILNSTTQKPLTKKVKMVKKLLGDKSNNRNSASVSAPQNIIVVPGSKHEWFDKATQLTAKVNQNLTTRLGLLTKEHSTVQSLEGLARVHNNLQEILSNSINSLMEVRKNLRSDFIQGLKKLKFTKPKESILYSQLSHDDNDVIVVDTTPAVVEAAAPAPPTSPKPTLGYLKVKPASELFGASVVTIPNDAAAQSTEPVAAASPDPIPDTSTPADTSNPAQELSEISEGLNPETVMLIKRALSESTFEKVLNDNLTISMNNVEVEKDELKKMASVRVLLETDYGAGTPQTRPSKDYIAMKLVQPKPIEAAAAVPVAKPIEEEEQDIEDILSASTLINPNRQISESVCVEDPDPELELDEPVVLEYGLGDREQNINSGLTNGQGSTVMV